MCDYTDSHFGASYPDACCVNGYLWDLDSCHIPGGPLYSGGDIPCPACNHDEWIVNAKEEIEEEGWMDAESGESIEDNPYKIIKLRFEEDRNSFIEFWFNGFNKYKNKGN